MSSSSSSERDRGVRFVDRWTSDRVKEWLKNIDGFVFDCDGVRVFNLFFHSYPNTAAIDTF